jgi:hypothetical protein
MAPPLPPVALPVVIEIWPEVPQLDVPVLKESIPEAPDPPELAVARLAEPDVVVVPLPLRISMFPPTLP